MARKTDEARTRIEALETLLRAAVGGLVELELAGSVEAGDTLRSMETVPYREELAAQVHTMLGIGEK